MAVKTAIGSADRGVGLIDIRGHRCKQIPITHWDRILFNSLQVSHLHIHATLAVNQPLTRIGRRIEQVNIEPMRLGHLHVVAECLVEPLADDVEKFVAMVKVAGLDGMLAMGRVVLIVTTRAGVKEHGFGFETKPKTCAASCQTRLT